MSRGLARCHDTSFEVLGEKTSVPANWIALDFQTLRSNQIHCWQRFFDPHFLFQFSKVFTVKTFPEKFGKNLNIRSYQNFRVKVDPVPISITLNRDTDAPP